MEAGDRNAFSRLGSGYELMGDADDSGETYYCVPFAYSDYDDFYF